MPKFPVATVATLTNLAPPAPPPGIVMMGAKSVLANNLPVARVGDTITPHGVPKICPMCNSGLNIIVTGCPTVLVEGQPLAVATSLCLCGHVLTPVNTAGIPQTVFGPGPEAISD